MKNVAELVRKNPRRYFDEVPHDWPLPKNLMGIELEVETMEGVKLPKNLSMWMSHRDGSLQNGVEYVLSRPMNGNVLRGAIREVMSSGTYKRSLTGSTHIHMDMLEDDTSPEILRTLVMLVYIMEPLLYASGDASREWCGYANRLRSGPDSILSGVMDENLDPQKFRRNYSRDSSSFGRYYGFNMAALTDYGSVEYRYFPTATSEEELVDWVELVQSTKKAAIAIGSRTRLFEIVEDESSLYSMLTDHFGKWQHLFPALGDYREIRNNYRKACITGSVQETEESLNIFTLNGREIFADGKFSKFVSSDSINVEVFSPTVFVNSGEPVPASDSVDVTTVLVYAGNVYINPRRLGRQWENDWRGIDFFRQEQLIVDQALVATLDSLLHQTLGSVPLISNSYVRSVIQGLVARTGPVTESPPDELADPFQIEETDGPLYEYDDE